MFKKNNTQKLQAQKQAETEAELINLEIEVKQETSESYNCLLTFTSNDENNKIKQIEYPAEEGKQPKVIQVADENGKQKIAVDYEIKEESNFKITTQKGDIVEKVAAINLYDANGGVFEEKIIVPNTSLTVDVTNLAPTKDGYHFLGWSTDKNAVYPDYYTDGTYSYTVGNILYAVYTEEKNGYKEEINNESLIGEVSKINTSGVQDITINGVTYSANVIVEDNDLVLDGEKEVTGATLANKTYEFGDNSQDVATASEYAKNMVVLKVNGNLTVNSNVSLTTCKSDEGYGGPKGIFIYCTGTLTNNGTISMTARGAYAEGQDVFLWQNADSSYEYVPAVGATGASAVWGTGRNGSNGNPGIERQTGGGAGGGAHAGSSHPCGMNKGGTGTSYSGGPGAGASAGSEGWSGAGSDKGGAGGYAVGGKNNASRRRSR